MDGVMREQSTNARIPQRRSAVQIENLRRRQDLAARENRRNPYLENYGQSQRARSVKQQPIDYVQASRRFINDQMIQEGYRVAGNPRRPTSKKQSIGAGSSVKRQQFTYETTSARRRTQNAQMRNRRIRRIKRIRFLFGLMCCVGVVALFSVVLARLYDEPQIDGTIAPGKEMQEPGVLYGQQAETIQGISREVFDRHPQWEEKLLTPNEYSRPGNSLETVESIFVHYTANPGTSAAQNRSYFEQLKDTHDRSVSAHFIVGYEGEIIQCLPLDEIGYAVQTRNYDSISIECCYLEEDGSFTQETYDSLISLLKWLTEAYSLDTEDILRHYDCGGKKCPLYYTEHPDAWERLKRDVKEM